MESQHAQVLQGGLSEPLGIQVAFGEGEVGRDVAWMLAHAPLQARERCRTRSRRGGGRGRLPGDHLAGAAVVDRAGQQRDHRPHHGHAGERGPGPAWPAPPWPLPAGRAARACRRGPAHLAHARRQLAGAFTSLERPQDRDRAGLGFGAGRAVARLVELAGRTVLVKVAQPAEGTSALVLERVGEPPERRR
ncbi:MAG TPA: hypothetical protein VFU54_21420 [Actinomycetota bacterium]|nr:hypothetical protein [Actinomycetota bacterium]